MFKAIRVAQAGPPSVMVLESMSIPVLAAGQVLVKIAFAGVNPIDTYLRSGKNPVAMPYTPGKDGSGTVAAVGEGVSKVKCGDRVYLSNSLTGTYAQYAVCSPSYLHLLPDSITLQQGAAVGVPYATAFRALFVKGRGKAGETVLVHGASGGVGIACVQLARAYGMKVIGTASSEAGRELVKREGAHHVVDHSSQSYLQEIMDLTNGQGVNLIMEMLANVNLEKDLGLVARQGRIAIIGARGTLEISPRLIMGKETEIIGVQLYQSSEQEMEVMHSAIFAGLANSTLRPIIGTVLPLSESAKAHEEIINPSAGAFGKVLLEIPQ